MKPVTARLAIVVNQVNHRPLLMYSQRLIYRPLQFLHKKDKRENEVNAVKKASKVKTAEMASQDVTGKTVPMENKVDPADEAQLALEVNEDFQAIQVSTVHQVIAVHEATKVKLAKTVETERTARQAHRVDRVARVQLELLVRMVLLGIEENLALMAFQVCQVWMVIQVLQANQESLASQVCQVQMVWELMDRPVPMVIAVLLVCLVPQVELDRTVFQVKTVNQVITSVAKKAPLVRTGFEVDRAVVV